MPTNRTKRARNRSSGPGGLTEAAYIFFTFGPFFEGEDFANNKTEDELRVFWAKHREAILKRYHHEKGRPDMDLWGLRYDKNEVPQCG
jgi:hypothetical protein